MKKFILLFLFCAIFSSCTDLIIKVSPIETYQKKGIVVLDQYRKTEKNTTLRVKNKEDIFYIQLSNFDAQNLKPGDTL